MALERPAPAGFFVRRPGARRDPFRDVTGSVVGPGFRRGDEVEAPRISPRSARKLERLVHVQIVAGVHQLEVNLLSSSALVDFDREPGIDAALRSGRGRWPGLIVEHLFDETLAPVASPALIERMGGPPETPAALARWPLLGDPGHQWQDWFARVGGTVPARFVAHFDDSETMHRAAVEGMGVALARMVRARLLVEHGQLVPLSELRLRTDYAHYLVYPPRSADHRGLLAFRDWLHEQTRAYAARQG